MNYKDDPKATNKELARIQKYLAKKGIKNVTHAMIIDAAITVTRRLGADDWTFYVELTG